MKVLVLFDLPRPVDPGQTFTLKALREQEDRPTEADVISALTKLGHQVETLPVYDNALAVLQKIGDCAPDVVFNLCESFFNERSHEPTIPALLELLRVPYTGAGSDALLLCKDKELAKTVLVYHRIRVPRFVVSRKRAPRRTLRRFGLKWSRLSRPFFPRNKLNQDRRV
jgi:D-alanine-D-alanine ligase